MRQRAIRLMLLAMLALVLAPLAWAAPCDTHTAPVAAPAGATDHHAPARQEQAPADCLAIGCPILHPMPAAALAISQGLPPAVLPAAGAQPRLAGTDPPPALPPPRRTG